MARRLQPDEEEVERRGDPRSCGARARSRELENDEDPPFERRHRCCCCWSSWPRPSSRSTDVTGLPQRIDWTFNLDAGWGTFGFGNSLYDNPKEGVPENLSDQWFEGYAKPAISGSYRLQSSSEIYGKVSVVGERTYGSIPEL